MIVLVLTFTINIIVKVSWSIPLIFRFEIFWKLILFAHSSDNVNLCLASIKSNNLIYISPK